MCEAARSLVLTVVPLPPPPPRPSLSKTTTLHASPPPPLPLPFSSTIRFPLPRPLRIPLSPPSPRFFPLLPKVAAVSVRGPGSCTAPFLLQNPPALPPPIGLLLFVFLCDPCNPSLTPTYSPSLLPTPASLSSHFSVLFSHSW